MDNSQPSSIVKRNLRSLVANVASLLTRDVVHRATIFILYLLVGRYLGVSEFGKMSVALSLFNVFQVIAMVGLRTLITREVAKDKTRTDRYLVNGSLVVIVTSLLSILILLLFVALMDYSADTASVIILLSLGLVPFSLSAVCEAVFQAWERMHYIAIANVPVSLARIVLTVLLLQQGQGLTQLILMLFASFVAVLVIEWWLMLQFVIKPHIRLEPRFSLAMTKSAAAFFGIQSLVAVRTSLYIVLLSILATETVVGLFNAVVQFTVPFILIFANIALGIFPAMCRIFDSTPASLKRISENSVELLLAIAVPAAVGIFFLAGPALSLVYGVEFALASEALQIVAWGLILRAPTCVLGQVPWASSREVLSLRIVLITTLVQLICGLILVGRYGLIGAAVGTLAAEVVDLALHQLVITRNFFRVTWGRLVWKPLVASAFMALCLAWMDGQVIPLTVLSAGTLYAVVLIALEIWSVGSARQLKRKYLTLFSE